MTALALVMGFYELSARDNRAMGNRFSNTTLRKAIQNEEVLAVKNCFMMVYR